MKRSSLILIAALVALSGGDAFAGPLDLPENPQALAKLTEGNRLYDLRSFEAAIEVYGAGYLIEASPLFLYNIAQSYRFLDRYEDAIHHYKAFLRTARPEGELRHHVERFISGLTAKRDRERLLKRESTEQNEGERVREPDPTTSPSPAPTPSEQSVAWYADPIGWTLAGVGAVGVGVGLGFFLNGSAVEQDAEAEQNQTRASELFDKADSRRLAGGVIGSVGVALLATGAIKLLVTPDNTSIVSASVLLSSEGTLVGLAGRF